MKVVQLHEQTPKQFLNPSTAPKIARQGPKKSKMSTKLSQNQKSEVKESQKMKVVQLHEQTPKQLSNPTITPKPAHQGPKKKKMTPKLCKIQMSELRESQKMKVVQLHEKTQKQVSNLNPTPKPVVEPYSSLQTSPVGPQKDKNDTKIKSNSNIRIHGIIENESCSTT